MKDLSTPNLGELLKNNLSHDAAAAQATAEDKARQKREQAESDQFYMKQFYQMARDTFTADILAGRRPSRIRVEGGNENSRAAELLRTYNKSPSKPGSAKPTDRDFDPYYPLWEAFRDWAAENGLEAEWVHDHDGVGIRSWYYLTVAPKAAPAPVDDTLDRKSVLLRAAFDILMQQHTSTGGVLDCLSLTAFYDGTECDGRCLLDDIADELNLDKPEPR